MNITVPRPDPFIVAEISGNHNGSIERALKLVEAASDAGADAVKFQLYDPLNMVADPEMLCEGGPWKGQKLRDIYARAQTPADWFPVLIDAAESRKLSWFSSVFDTGGITVLERLKCPIYKIASLEITDIPLIRAVAATEKPMIISTGAATTEQAHLAHQNAGKDVTMLRCVTAYPSEPYEAGLRLLQDMRKWWGCRVGLSDHSKGYGVAVASVAMGASVIEKHLDLSDKAGIDADFSLGPVQFALMVQAIHQAKAATHERMFSPTESERPLRKLQRSLWTRESVGLGERFTEVNVGAYRGSSGMQPIELRAILRCTAARDIPAGVPLQKDMLRA